QSTAISGNLKPDDNNRNQLNAGGRQISEGLDEGGKGLAKGVNLGATGPWPWDWRDTTAKTWARLQSWPDVHKVPVSAVASPWRQHSSTAPASAVMAPCMSSAMAQGSSKTWAFARP